jgi:hypothetical protein
VAGVDQSDGASTGGGGHLPAEDELDDQLDEQLDPEPDDGSDDGPDDGPDDGRGQDEQQPARWRVAAGRLQNRLRHYYASQRYIFVPATEVVAIDARQHPAGAGAPGGAHLRRPGAAARSGRSCSRWRGSRWSPPSGHRSGSPEGLRRSAIIGRGGLRGPSSSCTPWTGDGGTRCCWMLLLLWLLEDVLDWHSDRLVVTDKRIYRRHGVITRHSPSISLTAIAYIDAAVPPLGQLLHYGHAAAGLGGATGRPAVAPRPDPRRRAGVPRDPALRAAAMPKGPPGYLAGHPQARLPSRLAGQTARWDRQRTRDRLTGASSPSPSCWAGLLLLLWWRERAGHPRCRAGAPIHRRRRRAGCHRLRTWPVTRAGWPTWSWRPVSGDP